MATVAQEPTPAEKPAVQLQAEASELQALAAEAEALVRKGDMAGAREACKRALRRKDLADASDAWLAAAADALWKLGYSAYQAGELRTAHDAWAAVHRHRSTTLPDEHPDLQAARQALAGTKEALGDLPGAHALFEKVFEVRVRTLPDEHPDLQVARGNLAVTRRALGDLPGALALEEQVLAARCKTLPDDHPYLQIARGNLAATKAAIGDLRGALALQEKVLEVHGKTLPDDHADLQLARQNLAATKRALGDLHGALALQEQVLAVRARTLPDEHPDLQAARQGLANIRRGLGDLPGAFALQEQVFAVWSKNLPDDHPNLQAARLNLAGLKEALGDLAGAIALQEKVLTVWSESLPDDHPYLQSARQGLANTKRALGDLPGTLALEEKVLAVLTSTLPDEHPDLQTARGNLALTKRESGDLLGALALEEQVLAIRAKTLPDEHPDVQLARGNLAVTRAALGDLPGALALEERVLAIRRKNLHDEHPHLQIARLNLASTKKALGDLQAALELEGEVLAVRTRTLPDEHPDLEKARLNLAATRRMLGDLSAAAQLYLSGIAGARTRLFVSTVSTRDVAQLAVAATTPLSDVGSALDAASSGKAGALPHELAMSLTAEALALLTAARSAQGLATELLRHARTAAPTSLDASRLAVTTASQALEDAIALPLEGRLDGQGRRIRRDDAVREATLAKDVAERALLDSVPTALRTQPSAQTLAAGLAPDEAAVAFLTYTRWTSDAEKPWVTTSEPRFAAIVLTPAGTLSWHSLARVADIESLIATVRKDAAAGIRVGTRAATDTEGTRPGIDPEASSTSSATLTTTLTGLREQLLAPVLAALPKDTKRLVVSPADEMLLAPIEDLPLADGRTFGEAYDVQTVPSLRELIRKTKERTAEPRAFVVGGIDYDQAPAKQAPIVLEAATPILEPIATAPKPADTNPNSATRSGDQPTARPFAALPGTATEAEQLETLFAATFPTNTPTVLRKADASEAAFTEQAPGKTFLHLATHGYFAPETYWKATDARDDSPLARFDVGRNDRTAQLSPFSLTGIALAGANLPADELGRREGILTAQEITRLDLTACYLATLSACNTTLGVRRGGTGLASLRQAFHAAGARFVLATLWEVDDAEAQKLMTDFYTRLWKNGEEPRSAMRAAKRAARERGAAFRDWAGWLITGR
ncbi:MAG: CHAT domain-containing tetratricopeptide repeat protein [Planctomycetota bacterium]